jgi:hypothetical protein
MAQHDAEYERYLGCIQQRFAELSHDEPLFTTDAEESIWDTFLLSFSEGPERQYHNCYACRMFLARYGHLAIIQDGRVKSPMWDPEDAPPRYQWMAERLERLVRRATVTGVFYTSLMPWCPPVTGPWRHFAVDAPRPYRHPLLKPWQLEGEKRQDCDQVDRALRAFPVELLEQAMQILDTEALYRSEKVRGPAEWLYRLAVSSQGQEAKTRKHLIWRAVAEAPAGFCHPQSSMIGTLLEDLAAGLGYQEVARRFQAKMHPLQYQRPQAAPSAGTIAQAERLVEELGVARSLLRRFARIEEVDAFWHPKELEPVQAGTGVFGHLRSKQATTSESLKIPAPIMTWEKFARTVLPTADRLEWRTRRRDNYTAILAPVDPEAPVIFQWPHGFSWYLWHSGSTSEQWGLPADEWVRVRALTWKPCHWYGGRYDHIPQAVMVLLDGARETRQDGNALFPETLKAEYHGIRAVIEAYSARAEISEMAEGSACGVMLGSGSHWEGMARLRVASGTRVQEYSLDRWD